MALSLNPCIAMPASRPFATTGPPLLPGAIAASICRASRLSQLCVYVQCSTRATIPVVIESVSPPFGKP